MSPRAKKKPATDKPADPAVPVACAHTAIIPIEELKPHPKNPNTHPDEQVKLLANIIAKAGWRSPLVVSNRSGFIVKGHGRLKAAQFLGLKFVPVDFQDYVDEAAELADLIADNRIAELADWDRAVLKDILAELDTGAFDMLLTGFDSTAVEALMTALPPIDAPPDEKYTRKIDAPTYEPSDEKPSTDSLVSTEKSDQLINEIDKANIPEDVKAFLRLAAHRHDVFNFSFVADFYAHSDGEIKALFEKSALVIIDINKAIENGFVQMTKELAAQYGNDYAKGNNETA